LLDNEGLASGPTALAMYDDKIYWVDAKVVGDNAIRWISKTPPYDMGILVNNEDHLSALTVCHNERQHLDSHPCWDNNGNCSYLCLAVPADGGLKASCVCPIGYQLAPNGKTCNNYIDNYLVFAAKHRIGRISLDVRSFIDVTLHRVLPSQAPIYVDVDLATNDIYWIDGSQSPGIYRVPAEGGPSQRIIDCGIVRPTALAVDWVGRLLYWADSGTKRIEVSYLNGTNRLVLLEDKILAAEVSSIALDIQEFKMYWTSSITSRVVRANLDGTQSITIINGDKISNPLSIALDKSKLYLADNVKEKIFSYNKDGRNEASVATSTNPKGLAVDDSYVYWFDQSTHIIYKAPKRGVPNEASNERMIDGMNGVVDLKLISRKHWLQRGGFQYPCTSYNPCTHLCLPNSGVIGYNCACPTGIKVNTDHQSCPSTPMVYLLFSTLSSIRRISEDTRNFVDVCLINTFGRPLYIDFYRDFNGGKIMWTDPAKNSIMASNFNGSNIATFIQRIANPQGLSVDKSTGNVYYINGGNSPVIEVISNDGLFKKVLISTSLNNPTGILVHPQTGMMYWIDVDNDGASYIAQARMDGSNISRLIHNSTHQQPIALALDVVKDMLYWFNNANRTVERLPLMSNDTSIEIIVEGVDDINDIAVYGDVMYWSDKSTGRVTRYDIPTGRSFQVYSSDDAHGLVMVSTLPIVSSCTNNAGKCSDLCLPLSSVYYQCACSHGARGSCQEYIGSIQSGADIVSSSAVTSKSSASSLATISTSSITTVTAPSVKVK
jgi:low density lipoprotein receptor-related protein 5/6